MERPAPKCQIPIKPKERIDLSKYSLNYSRKIGKAQIDRIKEFSYLEKSQHEIDKEIGKIVDEMLTEGKNKEFARRLAYFRYRKNMSGDEAAEKIWKDIGNWNGFDQAWLGLKSRLNTWINKGSYCNENSREELFALAIILNLTEAETIRYENQEGMLDEDSVCMFKALHMQQSYDVRHYADWVFRYCVLKYPNDQKARWGEYCKLSIDIQNRMNEQDREIEEVFNEIEDIRAKNLDTFNITSEPDLTDISLEIDLEGIKREYKISGAPLQALIDIFNINCSGKGKKEIKKEAFTAAISEYVEDAYEEMPDFDEYPFYFVDPITGEKIEGKNSVQIIDYGCPEESVSLYSALDVENGELIVIKIFDLIYSWNSQKEKITNKQWDDIIEKLQELLADNPYIDDYIKNVKLKDKDKRLREFKIERIKDQLMPSAKLNVSFQKITGKESTEIFLEMIDDANLFSPETRIRHQRAKDYIRAEINNVEGYRLICALNPDKNYTAEFKGRGALSQFIELQLKNELYIKKILKDYNWRDLGKYIGRTFYDEKHSSLNISNYLPFYLSDDSFSDMVIKRLDNKLDERKKKGTKDTAYKQRSSIKYSRQMSRPIFFQFMMGFKKSVINSIGKGEFSEFPSPTTCSAIVSGDESTKIGGYSDRSIRNMLILLSSYPWFCKWQYGKDIEWVNRQIELNEYIADLDAKLNMYGFSTMSEGPLYDRVFLICANAKYPLSAMHVFFRKLYGKPTV